MRGWQAEALLDTGLDHRRQGSSACPPSSPAFHRPKRPALLCRSAKGGGKIIVGGATHEDWDRTGAGALTSLGRAPRSREHHPTDPRPLPLAGVRSRSEGVLPNLPDLPSDVTQDASPVRWYHCPSSRCLSSASGWTLWGRCLSLPGDMNTSWWLSTMPPGIQRQFPSEKPPPKPSPRNSSCSPAESASQRRSWPIRVPPLCPD